MATTDKKVDWVTAVASGLIAATVSGGLYYYTSYKIEHLRNDLSYRQYVLEQLTAAHHKIISETLPIPSNTMHLSKKRTKDTNFVRSAQRFVRSVRIYETVELFLLPKSKEKMTKRFEVTRKIRARMRVCNERDLPNCEPDKLINAFERSLDVYKSGLKSSIRETILVHLDKRTM